MGNSSTFVAKLSRGIVNRLSIQVVGAEAAGFELEGNGEADAPVVYNVGCSAAVEKAGVAGPPRSSSRSARGRRRDAGSLAFLGNARRVVPEPGDEAGEGDAYSGGTREAGGNLSGLGFGGAADFPGLLE